MRLGDLDALFCRFWGKADPFKEQPLVKPSAVWSKAATMAREAPTIDPETIPVVHQLREELARVTAERDAAVSDLENIMAYNSDTCQSCKNNQCYVRGGTKPCLPKWRGPRKEARP